MTEFWEQRRPKSKPKTTGWLIAACVVVGFWSLLALIGNLKNYAQDLGVALHDPGRAPEALGSLTGAVFFVTVLPAMVVWLILYFTVVFRRDPGRGGAHFGILLLVALLAHLLPLGLIAAIAPGAARNDQAQVDTALAELRDTTRKLSDPKADGASIDVRPKATGEIGKLEGLTKSLLAGLASDRSACNAELDATGFPDIMKAPRLGAPGGLTAAKTGLARARAVTDSCHQRFDARMAEYRREIDRADISPRLRDGALTGLDSVNSKQSIERMNRLWKLQSVIYAEFDQVVDGLAASRGRWVVRGKKVMFGRDDDLARFNQHMSRALAADAEIKSLQKVQTDRAKTAFAPESPSGTQ